MSNKTSDKNVANEEITNNKNKYTYIKEVAERIVNEYREKYKDEKFYSEPSEQTCMAYEILHLLAEREQDKARIKDLEEELEKANRQLDLDYVEENFIPKQQVKGKLKELKIERDKIYKEFIESNRLDKQLHVQGIYLDAQIIILQELLEGEK